MIRYFCISVNFLDPLFHGKGDGEEPEWPPSPMRLFQALVAGARTGCRGHVGMDAANEAFHWLEKRQPPEVVAPRVQHVTGYKLFVPNNDSDRELDRQERLTEKAVQACRLTEETPIHYLWQIRESEWEAARPHIQLLCRRARDIIALGWGIDVAFAVGRLLTAGEAAALSGIRWKTWQGFASPARANSRVPRDGTLKNLDEVHQSLLNSIDVVKNLYHPPLKTHVFATATYYPADQLPPRPSVGYILESPVGGELRYKAFPQSSTTVIAGMLRSRACASAKNDPHWADDKAEKYVAGHAGDADESVPRFSYLPLPTIGHPHADGLIRRVLVAEPYGASGVHSRWLAQRLRHAELIDESTKQPTAVLGEVAANDGVLLAYLGATQDWSTITPVILPGHDDGKHKKAEKLLIKAIVQAGIAFDAIEDLTFQKAPFLSGPLNQSE
jgi:CRISPR-associated protein Csb2